MNSTQKFQNSTDFLQQRSKLLGFCYAVLWKYGDDKAGYLVALLTYYGFLSLFPLLLIAATVTAMLSTTYPHLQETVITSITSYFPVIGNQLAGHVSTLHRNGFALLAGLLFMLYGARGVASAFRYGVNNIWHIPKSEQLKFPHSLLNNVIIILVAGGGFIVAAAVAAAIVSFNDDLMFRLLSISVDAIMLFWIFIALIKLSLPRHITIRQTWTGAALASIGLIVLQTVGGVLLARQLKNLDALYSYFAVSLGLLFWIYLQAQVVLFSIEVSAVHAKKLWPRNFKGELITKD